VTEQMAVSRTIASWSGLKPVLQQLSNLSSIPVPFWQWQPFWSRIIEDYTECSLTFTRDKWPAISGLATFVEVVSGERLVYGLWKNHLASELQWRSFGSGKRTNLGFPSWSWLSLDGAIGSRNTDSEGPNLRKLEDTAKAWSDASNDKVVHVQAPAIFFTSVVKGDSKVKFNVREVGSTCLEAGLWTADYDVESPLETWALQFQTVIYRDRKGREYRHYMGLVVTPHPNFNDLWTRVGTYVFKVSEEIVEMHFTRQLGSMKTLRLT
jgi:hypothetical protein